MLVVSKLSDIVAFETAEEAISDCCSCAEELTDVLSVDIFPPETVLLGASVVSAGPPLPVGFEMTPENKLIVFAGVEISLGKLVVPVAIFSLQLTLTKTSYLYWWLS